MYPECSAKPSTLCPQMGVELGYGYAIRLVHVVSTSRARRGPLFSQVLVTENIRKLAYLGGKLQVGSLKKRQVIHHLEDLSSQLSGSATGLGSLSRLFSGEGLARV